MLGLPDLTQSVARATFLLGFCASGHVEFASLRSYCSVGLPKLAGTKFEQPKTCRFRALVRKAHGETPSDNKRRAPQGLSQDAVNRPADARPIDPRGQPKASHTTGYSSSPGRLLRMTSRTHMVACSTFTLSVCTSTSGASGRSCRASLTDGRLVAPNWPNASSAARLSRTSRAAVT